MEKLSRTIFLVFFIFQVGNVHGQIVTATSSQFFARNYHRFVAPPVIVAPNQLILPQAPLATAPLLSPFAPVPTVPEIRAPPAANFIQLAQPVPAAVPATIPRITGFIALSRNPNGNLVATPIRSLAMLNKSLNRLTEQRTRLNQVARDARKKLPKSSHEDRSDERPNSRETLEEN